MTAETTKETAGLQRHCEFPSLAALKLP